MKKNKVIKYSLDGNFIEIYDSIKEACESVGLKTHSGIIGCCMGKPGNNSTKGFQWRYYEENYPLVIEESKKIGETFKKLYGKNSVNYKEIKDKKEKTSILKYGEIHHMKNESIKNKYKNKCIEIYGVDNPAKNIDIKNKISDKERNTKTSYFINNHIPYNIKLIGVSSDNIFELYDTLCFHKFNINRQLLTVRNRINHKICTICNPVDSNQVSEIENIFNNRLNSHGLNIERNIKGLLGTKHELDIYLPDYKIGIEINGSKFHSELHGKNEKYHLNKTEMFNNIGIRLFHFFDDEIENKLDIIESMILNSCGKSAKIYARKCTIKQISNKESINFLNFNHLQGPINSKFSYGLFYNSEMVSVMTFSEFRIYNGRSKEDGSYELLRFCNKIGLSVMGAASRLLKYFIKSVTPKKIITYANRRWSEGDLYKKLGFTFIKNTKPGYYYFYKNKRVHRYSLRKSELIKMGFDNELKTNQILDIIEAYRIWDCGNILFEMNILNTIKKP